MHSALELALWLILAATLAQNSFALVRSARQQRQLGALLGVLVLAGVLRLLVPFGPANWYLSVGSGESPLAFARPTALAPLPLRALARDWLPGARVFNGLASLAGIALFWYVATLAATRGARRLCSRGFLPRFRCMFAMLQPTRATRRSCCCLRWLS